MEFFVLARLKAVCISFKHKLQRQEQLQHSLSPSQSMQEQQTKSFKQVPVQQHDETPQLQHQQGISSSMHHLSQPAAPVAEKNQLQQKPSLSKSIMAKQEPREPGANPVNLEQNVAESIKNPEPVLLDERALLACLVRAVPAEANAKISMKSTVSVYYYWELSCYFWGLWGCNFGVF